MRIGVIFPQTESGTDPGAIREYVQAVEAMGFAHILVYDHVTGAHPDQLKHIPWAPYNHESLFHEVFVLMGYMAALTKRIELVTGVLVLPQRETALVAKQAAEVDLLSGGRLRLGVGVGWNDVEFKSLGADFRSRGKRQAEQVEVLRRLWSEPLVDFAGEYHRLQQVGIKPLPVQRPIPVWFGGGAPAMMERMAVLGDGWMPLVSPTGRSAASFPQRMAELHEVIRRAGRDPARFGLDGRVTWKGSEEQLAADAAFFRENGATHLSVLTMDQGYANPQEHLQALERVRQVLLTP